MDWTDQHSFLTHNYFKMTVKILLICIIRVLAIIENS